jgi:hypothetical protein
MQTPDHVDRQASATIEDFGYASPAAEDPFQVLSGQALLLHPEFDRLDGSGGSIG